MGRKPNPYVVRYFQRGQKLSDSSNRYPQTCKLCGEVFPKGRTDSLMTHVTKRCLSISAQERLEVCLEVFGPAGIPAQKGGEGALYGESHVGEGNDDDDVRILAVVPKAPGPQAGLTNTGSFGSGQHLGYHQLDPGHQLQHQHHQSQHHQHQHGVSHSLSQQHPSTLQQDTGQINTSLLDPTGWSALEALAEASRQVDLGVQNSSAEHGNPQVRHQHLDQVDHFDLHEHLHQLGAQVHDNLATSRAAADRMGESIISAYSAFVPSVLILPYQHVHC